MKYIYHYLIIVLIIFSSCNRFSRLHIDQRMNSTKPKNSTNYIHQTYQNQENGEGFYQNQLNNMQHQKPPYYNPDYFQISPPDEIYNIVDKDELKSVEYNLLKNSDFPLHEALETKQKFIIIKFLSSDKRINSLNCKHKTPLDYAEKYRLNYNFLKDKGALHSIDILLIEAVKGKDYTNITKLIKKEGANIAVHNIRHNTLLHFAALNNDVESINLLLTLDKEYKKIDINALNKEGNTPMTEAVFKKHADSAELLMKNGGIASLRLLKVNQWFLVPRIQNHTQIRQIEIAQKIRKKYQRNINDPHWFYGYTPLWEAVLFRKNIDDMQLLLAHPGIALNTVNRFGSTLIHELIKKGQVSLTKMLIHAGVDIEIQDIYGISPLIVASKWNQAEIVEELIKQKVNLDSVDHRKNNALHWAAYNNNFLIVKQLVTADIKLNIKNYSGYVAIDYAIKNSKVEELLKAHKMERTKTCVIL